MLWSGWRQCSSAVSTCADQDRPDPLGQLVARLRPQVEGVEDRAPDVVLSLLVGVVPDPHRSRAVVAGQVIERRLRQVALAADPVHDLQPALLGLRDLGDEEEEVVRLPVEPERVERPEHEGGVADPRVAVVPVARAARRLGQRRRRGCDQRAGRRVREPLQRERAPLQVGAPGMVGELAALEPVLPVVRRPHEALVGVFVVRQRRRVLGPRERDEERLLLLHARAGDRARPLETDPHVRRQPELDVDARPARDGGVIPLSVVVPLRPHAAVVEGRLALQVHLHLAVHAAHEPQQHVVGVVVGR